MPKIFTRLFLLSITLLFLIQFFGEDKVIIVREVKYSKISSSELSTNNINEIQLYYENEVVNIDDSIDITIFLNLSANIKDYEYECFC